MSVDRPAQVRSFRIERRKYPAIEAPRWGQLAKKGHAVVQFKDVDRNRFIAVTDHGQVKEFSAMRSARGQASSSVARTAVSSSLTRAEHRACWTRLSRPHRNTFLEPVSGSRDDATEEHGTCRTLKRPESARVA